MVIFKLTLNMAYWLYRVQRCAQQCWVTTEVLRLKLNLIFLRNIWGWNCINFTIFLFVTLCYCYRINSNVTLISFYFFYFLPKNSICYTLIWSITFINFSDSSFRPSNNFRLFLLIYYVPLEIIKQGRSQKFYLFE